MTTDHDTERNDEKFLTAARAYAKGLDGAYDYMVRAALYAAIRETFIREGNVDAAVRRVRQMTEAMAAEAHVAAMLDGVGPGRDGAN